MKWFYHVTCFAKVLKSCKVIITSRFIIKKSAHIKWDVIPSSLRLLLKVWIWHICQNGICQIALAHFQTLFGKGNRDAFWENEGKIHERMCERVLFVNLQAGISQLHYRLTSSQIVFRDFKYLLRF